jgi:dTDP-4-amino-4,6-dideoxygalactose transaminase
MTKGVDAFAVVRQFEQAVADFTGAPYAVAVNSCTNALFLSLKYKAYLSDGESLKEPVSIPMLTYVSVGMQIMHAGYKLVFREEDWQGSYELSPLNIHDAARRFRKMMYLSEYDEGAMVCTSHHWSKILGVQQGGMILTDSKGAVTWLKKARFDGRTEGVAPADDKFGMLGYHMYMSPEIAAEGLVRLSHLKNHTMDLPRDDYPDLSKMEIFK